MQEVYQEANTGKSGMDFVGDFVNEQFKRQINDYKLKAQEQEQERHRTDARNNNKRHQSGRTTEDDEKNGEHIDGKNPENREPTEYIVEYNEETGEYLVCRENQQKRIHQHTGSPMVELFRINVEDHDAADQEWWWAVCTE